jgi:hypothetical protein
MMVNFINNINKTNNHLTPQAIEQKKKTRKNGNPVPSSE